MPVRYLYLVFVDIPPASVRGLRGHDRKWSTLGYAFLDGDL